MTRKEELLNLIGDDKTLIRLVDEVCFLEKQLDYLKQLPQIRVDPANPERQKTTPAAKQYKEMLQQYTNCIKVLSRINDEDEKEVSPLRKWAGKYVNSK